MKRIHIAGIVLGFIAMLFLTSSAYGQTGMHKPNREFRGKNFQRGEFHKQDFKGMMLEKLNLTDEQKAAVEKLKLKHQGEMIDLKANLEKKKLALKELTSNGNYSRDDFVNAVKAISTAKSNIAISMANHRMDIYELLTPEQKKTFNNMHNHFNKRRSVLRHMMEKFEE